MTERVRRCAFSALGIILLLYSIRNWTTTVKDLLRFYTNMPFWDAYNFVAHYSNYKHLDWSVLWIQHNEHRIIVAEFIFAIDFLLFHGNQIFITVVGVTAYVGVLLIFAWFVLRKGQDCWSGWSATLMMAVLAGYKLCAVSLTIPFLVCWSEYEFLVAAALAAAALHKSRKGMLVAAIVCSVLATYSLANGMMIWPVLLAAGFLLRFGRWELAAIAISGTLSSAAYFFHYQNLHSFDWRTLLGHRGYLAGFLGNFVGMPFSAADGFSNPWLAAAFGWFALIVFAGDLIWIYRRRLWHASPVIVLGGYGIVSLLSAALTAAGRMNPDDPFFQAARAGRYITQPTLFWCALIMLTAWVLSHTWRGFGPLPFLLLIAVMAGRTLPRTNDYYTNWEIFFERGQWAAIGAANGVAAGDVSDLLFPGREYLALMMPILVDNRLAAFAGPEPGWIGNDLHKFFLRGQDGFFPGAVTTIRKHGADYEVQGWSSGVTTVVFADEASRILGFGVRPRAGPAQLYSNDVPPNLAFTGFIQGKLAGQAFSVWGIDRHKKHMTRLGKLWNRLPR